MNSADRIDSLQELVDIRQETRSLPNKNSRNELLTSLQQLEESINAGGKFENNLTVPEAKIFYRLSGLVLKVVKAAN